MGSSVGFAGTNKTKIDETQGQSKQEKNEFQEQGCKSIRVCILCVCVYKDKLQQYVKSGHILTST